LSAQLVHALLGDPHRDNRVQILALERLVEVVQPSRLGVQNHRLLFANLPFQLLNSPLDASHFGVVVAAPLRDLRLQLVLNARQVGLELLQNRVIARDLAQLAVFAAAGASLLLAQLLGKPRQTRRRRLTGDLGVVELYLRTRDRLQQDVRLVLRLDNIFVLVQVLAQLAGGALILALRLTILLLYELARGAGGLAVERAVLVLELAQQHIHRILRLSGRDLDIALRLDDDAQVLGVRDGLDFRAAHEVDHAREVLLVLGHSLLDALGRFPLPAVFDFAPSAQQHPVTPDHIRDVLQARDEVYLQRVRIRIDYRAVRLQRAVLGNHGVAFPLTRLRIEVGEHRARHDTRDETNQPPTPLQ
jgi:hypothetical protein